MWPPSPWRGTFYPPSMHSLARYFDGGPEQDGSAAGWELLCLGVAAATQEGHPPVILGVARQGSLITWDLPRNLLRGPTPGTHQNGGVGPVFGTLSARHQDAHPPHHPRPLSGKLSSACFGPDGLSLLLVAPSGWLFLESDKAEFEGGPQHLVPQEAGGAAELRDLYRHAQGQGAPDGLQPRDGDPSQAVASSHGGGLAAVLGQEDEEDLRRDGWAEAGRESGVERKGMMELQGGGFVWRRGACPNQVEAQLSRPAVVIWDGRGQVALLQLLPRGGHMLLGTTAPVGIDPMLAVSAQESLNSNTMSVEVLNVTARLSPRGHYILMRVACVDKYCGIPDAVMTCFRALNSAEPLVGTAGALEVPGDRTCTDKPPAGSLVLQAESSLSDLWWFPGVAGPRGSVSCLSAQSRVQDVAERHVVHNSSGGTLGDPDAAGTVTVSITVGGDPLVPRWLIQGFSSGQILAVPLCTAAVHNAASWRGRDPESPGCTTRSPGLSHGERATSASLVTWLSGHGAAVCCLVGHRALPDEAHMLLSGSSDGTVCGWSLSGDRPSPLPVFCSNLHSEPVTKILAPAVDGMQPWGSCFASASEDGSVCITGLGATFDSRSLPGYPGGVPTRLAWVPTLGYLACLFRLGPSEDGHPPEHATVAVVWDAHSCKQDRVVAGAAGEELIANFESLGPPGSSLHSPQPHYIHMSPESHGIPPGMALLEVDVSGLIQLKPEVIMGKPRTPPGIKPFGGTGSPKRPGTPGGLSPRRGQSLPSVITRKASAPGGEAAALATALAVLHMWGLDDVADRQMVGMVASLGLLGRAPTERPRSPAGAPGQPQLPLASSVALIQGAIPVRSLESVTVQWPNLIRQPPQGTTNGVLPVPRSASTHPPAGLPEQPGGGGGLREANRGPRSPMWRYGLLRGSREHVALRTLAMVSLGKRLMTRAHVTEQLGNCCSLVVALYAVSLREALPDMAVPKLELFASLWQDPRGSVREAARSLLSAATDPSSYRVHGPVPFQHLLLLFRRGTHPAHISAAQLLDPAIEDGEWEMEAVLAAGAACAFHPRVMPDQLLELVVPKLVVAVLSVPQPHSAVAAALLADGLLGLASSRWRPLLGDISTLLHQILVLCEQYGSGVAPSSSSLSESDQARAAWQRSATVKATPGREIQMEAARKMLRVPTSQAVAGPLGGPSPPQDTPASGNPGQALAPTETVKSEETLPISADAAGAGGGGREGGGAKGQAMQRTPSMAELRLAMSTALSSAGRPGGGGVGVASTSSSTGSSSGIANAASPGGGRRPPARTVSVQRHLQEVVAWRDGVAALLPGLAVCDVPLFLHVLGHRLGGGAPPESPSHVMLVEGIASLAQSRAGQAALAPYLQLVASVLLKGLDPATLALRRTCLQVVTMAVKQLCMRFPMVAFCSNPLQLAVGRAPLGPGTQGPQGAGDANPGTEPIAVFDMESGQKKRALHFRVQGPTEGQLPDEVVSAVAFSPAGDLLAGFTADETTLRVWPLVAGWSQRLQRSAAVILPSKVVKVPISLTSRGRSGLLGGPDLGWSLRWEGPSSVTVMHASQAVTVNF
eukprot:jgi/Botrbrau1/7187/Bobra.0300s0017.1